MAMTLTNILKHKPITAIFISISSGVIIGLMLKYFTEHPWYPREIMYIKFPGELFLRLLNCLILPFITSAIVSATYNLCNSGGIGLMALYYYLTTTSIGITLSIILVQVIRPGELFTKEHITLQNSTYNSIPIDTLLDLLRNLIPDNIVLACLTQYQTVLEKPDNASTKIIEEWFISYRDIPGTNILGLVFVSVVFGIALGKIDEKGKPIVDIFNCLSKVITNIMSWIIMITPCAVLFLIVGRILEIQEFDIILKQLVAYILTVFAGLLIQGFIILPLLYFITTRQSPYKVISKIGPALATACGTSSSTATIPVTLKCLDNIGIDPKISKFVVPIGATINMDGIALYESIGAIFIIQLHDLEFSLIKIIIISITCTVSCIGAAGLPNGGYAMLIMVLNSVGVPAEDVTLIIAIDCFVDRFRTTINIISDVLGCCIISHFYENSSSKISLTPVETKQPRNLNNI